MIEPPHHRPPPQRIASQRPNHFARKPSITFATKSALSGHSRQRPLMSACGRKAVTASTVLGKVVLNKKAPPCRQGWFRFDGTNFIVGLSLGTPLAPVKTKPPPKRG